jgi:hypothetical protein
MTGFEEQLRRGLADAADSAPTFAGVAQQAPQAAPARRRPPARWMAAAAAAAVVAVGGTGIWAAVQDDSAPAASCAAEGTFEGHTYTPRGDVARVPRTGSSVGSLVLASCDDGQGASGGDSLAAFGLPGVDPGVAVVADGTVWLREGAATPAPVQELSRPVPCQGPAATIAGRLREVDAQAQADFAVRAPYSASVLADQGPGLPLEDYSAVLLQVAVTEQTTAGTDPALLRAALAEGRRITVSVVCSGSGFTATAMALAP